MKVKKVKTVVVDAPEFRSDAEEAAWWDRHQVLIADLAVEARPPRRRAHEEHIRTAAGDGYRKSPQAGRETRLSEDCLRPLPYRMYRLKS